MFTSPVVSGSSIIHLPMNYVCTQGLYTVLIKSWSNVIKQQHKLAQLRKLCFMFFYRTGIRIITVSFPTSSLQRNIFLVFLYIPDSFNLFSELYVKMLWIWISLNVFSFCTSNILKMIQILREEKRNPNKEWHTLGIFRSLDNNGLKSVTTILGESIDSKQTNWIVNRVKEIGEYLHQTNTRQAECHRYSQGRNAKISVLNIYCII